MLSAYLWFACLLPIQQPTAPSAPILPDPPVLVRRYATHDHQLDLQHAAAILSLAVRQYGAGLVSQGDFEQTFQFAAPALREAFLDAVESTDPLFPGAPERWRDVVLDADTLVPGGRLHGTGYEDPTDSLADGQWAFDLHHVEKGWQALPDADALHPVTVAVLDTGIDMNHPELAGRIAPGGKSFVDGGVFDTDGHGTHVAGVIAAIVGNGTGVAGMTPTPKSGPPIVKVLPLRVWKFGGDQQTNAKNVADAILYAVAQGAQVINISFGMNDTTPALDDAISFAIDARVPVIASAGDTDAPFDSDGTYSPEAENVSFPAAHAEVIAAGGLRGHEPPAAFNAKEPHSNWGDLVDVGAHSNMVWSSAPNATFKQLTGTSLAAAHVAGLAALLKSMLPLTDADRLRSFITANAYASVGNDGGPTKPSKHGTIDFDASIRDALDAIPDATFCPGLPDTAPYKLKAEKHYAPGYRLTFPGGSETGEPANLKDEDDQCSALHTLLAKNDGLQFLLQSQLVNKKQQTAFQLRFVTNAVPAGPITAKVNGALLANDAAAREIEFRYFDYSLKTWSAPLTKVVASGQEFTADFTLDSAVLDHVKSPQGIIRCRLRARHAAAGSKTSGFQLFVDRVSIDVN